MFHDKEFATHLIYINYFKLLFFYNNPLSYLFNFSTIKSLGSISLQKYAVANGLPSVVKLMLDLLWNPIRWSNDKI